KFPETCKPYKGLQEIFYDMLKEKCPTVCKYYGFQLVRCKKCKHKLIQEKHFHNLFISGGGRWRYNDVSHHFACYTYGSCFDNSHHSTSDHEFIKSECFCDPCIVQGILDHRIEDEYEDRELYQFRKRYKREHAEGLVHKYDVSTYHTLYKEIVKEPEDRSF